MHLLDSSVIIAFFRKRELDHKKARDILSSLDGFAVSDYVISEVATVLRIKEGVQIAGNAIGLLKWNTNVEVARLSEEEFEETIHSFLNEKKTISFTDASLIILAKKRGLKLVTFDEDLRKIASRN